MVTRVHWNNPKAHMNAVNARESLSRGVWWYPAVKSINPNTVGLASPILFRVSLIFGMDQPSNAPVQAFNWTKSNVNLHLPSVLGTKCERLHAGAWLTSMTPRKSKASTWPPLSQSAYHCSDVELVVGCARPPTCLYQQLYSLAHWCLTLVEKTSMYSSQSFLSFAWNPTEP